jgi:hypothetical protein
MAHEGLLIDPELEGLLRELAEDPRSSLLRVRRPADLAGVFEGAPAATAATAGLTSLERHLVQARRTDLAQLLRDACLIRFFGDPELDKWVARYVTVDEQVNVPDESAWRGQARREAGMATSDPATCDGVALLQKCLRTSDFHSVSISELAVVSIRLEPTHHGRLYVCADLATRNQADAAERIARGVLGAMPSPSDASHAWEALALCASLRGDFVGAVEAAQKACDLPEPRPQTQLYWLYYALMARDSSKAAEASDRLRGFMDSDHPVIVRVAQQLRSQQAAGVWDTGPRTREFVKSIMDDLGVTARRIADALC